MEKKHSFIIASAVLMLLLVILLIIEWYGPIPQAGLALEGKLTETQKNSVGLIIDLSKLFMGWSLAVIGGIGYFLRANLEKEYPLSKIDLFLCEAIILTSVVSIFYGHLTINYVITMLILDILNLKDSTLALDIRIQYISFLTSLLLFGAYLHNTFTQRIKIFNSSSNIRKVDNTNDFIA